jgi:benzoyl-CoA reductase/2-hydroxyglutaryl-CoA dehydratase subunit BcrC/BadD/HgdB
MSHNKTAKKRASHEIDCCDATMEGIHHWYKRMFEELGWMILAKHRNMLDKTSTYKNSLDRLKTAIEQKLARIHDKDKKDDLEIMHKNVLILIEHAHVDL